jgi:hypothetical protein
MIGIIFLYAAKKLNLFFSPRIYFLPYYWNFFERTKSLLASENQVEFLLIKTTT